MIACVLRSTVSPARDVCVERTEVAAALYASQFHSLSRRSLFAEVQLCCDRHVTDSVRILRSRLHT